MPRPTHLQKFLNNLLNLKRLSAQTTSILPSLLINTNYTSWFSKSSIHYNKFTRSYLILKCKPSTTGMSHRTTGSKSFTSKKWLLVNYMFYRQYINSDMIKNASVLKGKAKAKLFQYQSIFPITIQM